MISDLVRYGAALLSAALATLAEMALEHFSGDRSPALIFTLPVIWSAFFFGMGPGLVAGAASLVGLVVCFSDLGSSAGTAHSAQAVSLVLYVLIAVLTSVLLGERRRALLALQRGAEERNQLLTSEREARAAVERASRVKDEFLATLSHELRTPLNAMLGWASLLKDRPREVELVAKGADVIDRNVRIQAQIIEDLLDMSRMMLGKIRLDVQTVDLGSIVEAAVSTVRASAEAKRISLTVRDMEVLEMRADARRLQQVLWNLISNAIKFTPPRGSVEVRVRKRGEKVEIIVRDTGKGISPDFLPYVFQRFRQAEAGTTRRQGGIGLGLAIVKELVELHGGTVRAESEGEGRGSTFIVELPQVGIFASDGPSGEAANPRAARHMVTSVAMNELPPLQGLEVLIVDDEPDARDLMQMILEEQGAKVTTAGSMDAALHVCAERRFDVLLSDIGMPEHDGYELIQRLRALEADQGLHIPAVAVTALARGEDRDRALSSGYEGHVSKPVHPSEIIQVVASLVGRRATPVAAFGG